MPSAKRQTKEKKQNNRDRKNHQKKLYDLSQKEDVMKPIFRIFPLLWNGKGKERPRELSEEWAGRWGMEEGVEK